MMRSLLCTFVLVGTLAQIVNANDPPTVNADDSNTIVVDLNATAQIGRVKFDLPIVLQLSLEADVTRVDVYRSPESKDPVCDNTRAFTIANTWRRFTLGRSPAEPATGAETAPKEAAYITVGPIEANRHVCFRFTVTRRLAPGEITQFNEAAVRSADQTLRVDTRVLATGFSDAQIDTLRDNLRTTLLITLPTSPTGVRRDVPPGSILSEKPSPQAMTDFIGILRGVFEATANRDSIVADLERQPGQVDQAASALVSLATNPFLETYRDQILTVAKGDTTLAAAFTPVETAINRVLTIRDPSADITIGRARGIALGLSFGVSNPRPFRDVWRVADVIPNATATQSWFDSLRTIQQFATLLPPAVNPPFFAGELKRLRDQLDLATATLDQVIGAMVDLQGAVKARHDALMAFAQRLGNQVSADAFIGTSSFANFNTRAMWYLSVDVGLGSAPHLESVFPYVGGNIYFRPVNKQAPLSQRSSFGRRFSAMVGVTFSTDLSQPGRIENSIGDDRMLLLGAGYRITDLLRIGGGVVVVKALDPNPLVTREPRHEFTPFLSLSIDWDARGTFEQAFRDTSPKAVSQPR